MQTRYPLHRQLSYGKYFMQDMNHGVEEEVLAVSLNLFLTVAIDGEEPSYTASKRSQKKNTSLIRLKFVQESFMRMYYTGLNFSCDLLSDRSSNTCMYKMRCLSNNFKNRGVFFWLCRSGKCAFFRA